MDHNDNDDAPLRRMLLAHVEKKIAAYEANTLDAAQRAKVEAILDKLFLDHVAQTAEAALAARRNELVKGAYGALAQGVFARRVTEYAESRPVELYENAVALALSWEIEEIVSVACADMIDEYLEKVFVHNKDAINAAVYKELMKHVKPLESKPRRK